MIYLIYLLFSYFWLWLIGREEQTSFGKYFFRSLPVVVGWLFIVGGQDGIGSDYNNYLYLFNGHYWVEGGEFDLDKELGFNYLIRFFNALGFYGQVIFFFLAVFFVAAFFYSVRKISGERNVFLAFFLFVTMTTGFNNQMNGIRQYIAIFCFAIWAIALMEKNYKQAMLFFALGISMHYSMIMLLPIAAIIIFKPINKNRKLLSLFVLASIFVTLFFSQETFVSLLEYIDFGWKYDRYIYSQYIEVTSMFIRLQRCFHAFPVFCSIWLLPKMQLDILQQKYFTLGLYGFCFWLCGASVQVLGRFGSYFVIFGFIPTLYLLIYLRRRIAEGGKLSFLSFLLIIGYYLAFYSYKVLFVAEGEYDFQSVFF